jgi:hypothetical protein
VTAARGYIMAPIHDKRRLLLSVVVLGMGMGLGMGDRKRTT